MRATLLTLMAALPCGYGRSLYPTGAALRTGLHAVGGPHKLYYEVHGKAGGAPALFLHGGPGAGCVTRHAGFFDPKHYQVVLFDQRGCGKSTPKGSLEDNDTSNLVADIESLRELLEFERWSVVVGGSWGTTLALAYAQAHPESVGSIVLRAVCLMRQREIRWLFGAKGGAALLHPEGSARWHSLWPPVSPGNVEDEDYMESAEYAAYLEYGTMIEELVSLLEPGLVGLQRGVQQRQRRLLRFR